MAMDPAKRASFERKAVTSLVVVLVGVLLYNLKPWARFKPMQTLQTMASDKVSLPDTLKALHNRMVNALDDQQAQEAEERPPVPAPRYTAQALRDPFKSVLPDLPSDAAAAVTGDQTTRAPAVDLPALRITGVVWGGARPLAMINGKLHGVGDSVEGVKILGIDRHGVTVEYGGVKTVVALERQFGDGQPVTEQPRGSGADPQWR